MFLSTTYAFILLTATSALGASLPNNAANGTVHGSKSTASPAARWMDLRLSDRKFDVRTKRGNSTGFRYTFSTTSFPRFRVAMFDGEDLEACGPTYTYAVGVHRIVEVNGTIGWRDSASFLDLRKGTWTPLVATNATAASGGAAVTTITTTYTPTGSSGTAASVEIYTQLSAREAALSAGGGVLRPNALKYGIVIDAFPYRYANSTLAIVKAIYSASAAAANSSAATVSLGAAGSFGWSADVDLVTESGAAAKGTVVASAPASARVDGVDAFVRNEWADEDGESADVTGGNESASVVVFKVAGPTGTVSPLVHAKTVSWDPEMSVFAAFQGDPAVSAAMGSVSPVKALAALAVGWIVLFLA